MTRTKRSDSLIREIIDEIDDDIKPLLPDDHDHQSDDGSRRQDAIPLKVVARQQPRNGQKRKDEEEFDVKPSPFSTPKKAKSTYKDKGQGPTKAGEKKPSTPRSSPSKSTSHSDSSGKAVSAGGGSAKSIFAEIIVEAGLKGYDRALVEAETGLTKNQQIEMLKKGRGSMWRALVGHVSSL